MTPSRDQLGDPGAQHGRVAALEQVADQHEHGVAGPGDEPPAVAEGAADVGAAAELHAEQHVDGVGEQRREVGDGGVEGDHRRAQRRQPGEHAGEQRGVDDAAGHRAALVDGDDDVAGEAALVAAEPDEPLGHDRAVLGQPVAQVGADRPRPVDVGRAGPAGAAGPGERAAHGLAGAVGEARLELAEHGGDRPGGPSPWSRRAAPG